MSSNKHTTPVSHRAVSPDNQADVSVSEKIGSWIKSVFKSRNDEPTLKEALEEAMEEVLEEHEEKSETLPAEEKRILRNVLNIGDTTLEDIMIPRSDIIAVPEDISLNDFKCHIIEQRHTRTPVYRDTLDHIEGFLHVKDLVPMLSGDKPYDLKAVLRTVLFVPPSMKVITLLAKMRLAGSHMAIVVDEYGGTDGLITMEDLVEEIVGEIQDEHDEEEGKQDIVRISPLLVDVLARTRIDRLEKELGLNLVSEERVDDFDTLGGLVFFHLGRVPNKGERVNHINGLQFEILEADARRIYKVRIHLHPALPNG